MFPGSLRVRASVCVCACVTESAHTLSSYWLWLSGQVEPRVPAGPVQSSRRQKRQITPMATSRSGGRLERVFRGTFVHSTPDAALQILEDALLGVDSAGKVCHIYNPRWGSGLSEESRAELVARVKQLNTVVELHSPLQLFCFQTGFITTSNVRRGSEAVE